MTIKQYLVVGIGTLIIAMGAALGIQTFGNNVFGASVFATFQGGTGTSSPSGILYGSGNATPLKTVGIGSNLTFSGGTLSAAASAVSTTSFAATYPIQLSTSPLINYSIAFGTTTVNSWSQLQTFQNGLLSQASSTFTALLNMRNASTSLLTVSTNEWLTALATPAGAVLAVDTTGKIIATTTAAGGVSAVTGTYPVQSSGGSTPAISLAFGTTTANTWNLLQTFTGGFLSQASSTVSGQFTFINASSTQLTATTAWHTNLTTTNGSSTFQSVLTSLWIPNSASQAPIQAGQLALDTTNDQMVIGDGTATSVFDKRRNLLLQYATTTSWSGTTTLPAFVIPMGYTWNTITCLTQPAGTTLNAQYQYANSPAYATVNSTMVPASSTPGIVTFSTNNTPTSQATSTISFGTPANSPVSIGCTLSGVVTAT